MGSLASTYSWLKRKGLFSNDAADDDEHVKSKRSRSSPTVRLNFLPIEEEAEMERQSFFSPEFAQQNMSTLERVVSAAAARTAASAPTTVNLNYAFASIGTSSTQVFMREKVIGAFLVGTKDFEESVDDDPDTTKASAFDDGEKIKVFLANLTALALQNQAWGLVFMNSIGHFVSRSIMFCASTGDEVASQSLIPTSSITCPKEAARVTRVLLVFAQCLAPPPSSSTGGYLPSFLFSSKDKKDRFQYGFTHILARRTLDGFSTSALPSHPSPPSPSPPPTRLRLERAQSVFSAAEEQEIAALDDVVEGDEKSPPAAAPHFFLGDFGGGGLELVRVTHGPPGQPLVVEDFKKDRFLRGPGKQEAFFQEIRHVFAVTSDDQEAAARADDDLEQKQKDKTVAYLRTVDNDSLVECLFSFLKKALHDEDPPGEQEDQKLAVAEGEEGVRCEIFQTGKLRNIAMYGRETSVENLILFRA